MASDNVVNELAKDLLTFISDECESVSSSYIEKRLEVLDLLLSVESANDTAPIAKLLEEETVNLQLARQETDLSLIISEVQKAEKSRLDKLEYETMAKLLNRTESRNSLREKISQYRASIDTQKSESCSLTRKLNVRKLALIVLTHLIASMQESMLHEPSVDILSKMETMDNFSL